MIMYKQISLKGVIQNCVERTSDGAIIPFDPDNTDYQAYLAWVAQGGVPLPADE
jgi:cytochrome c